MATSRMRTRSVSNSFESQGSSGSSAGSQPRDEDVFTIVQEYFLRTHKAVDEARREVAALARSLRSFSAATAMFVNDRDASTLARNKPAADAKLQRADARLDAARELLKALVAARAPDNSNKSSNSESTGASDAAEALRGLLLDPEADTYLGGDDTGVAYYVPAAANHKLSNMYASERGVQVGAVSPPAFICDPTAGEFSLR